MGKGIDKDWLDAVREQCLPDGAAPSPDGWSQVGRKMRRAAARRRAVLAAAVALPVAAILLFPWRQPADTGSPVVQENRPIIETESAGPAEPAVLLPQSDRILLADGAVSGRLPVRPARPAVPDSTGNRAQAPASAPSVLPSESPVIPSESPVIPSEPPVIPSEVEGSPAVIPDLIGDPATRQKSRWALRLSVSRTSASGRPLFRGLGVPHTNISKVPAAPGNAGGGVFAFDSEESDAATSTTASEVVYVPEEPSAEPIPVPKPSYLPVSLGLAGELSLSRHWSLLAGLDYTQRPGYRVKEYLPQSLTLHYLGLPLEAHYHFWPEGRFRLYLGGGLKVEKCLFAAGGDPLPDPFLVSANLQAGADFRIMPGLRLYVAPTYAQYINRSAYVNTWDTRPSVSLHVGLSFDMTAR